MPRIYLPAAEIRGDTIFVTGEKAHYLTSVLRCRIGDELILFDGRGNCFRTSIRKTDRREVVAKVLEGSPCNLESPRDIVLVQGLLKGEKMDLVIQKTTELGVREIVPVVAGRSQVREARKIDRWKKIAEEASRQSGRSVIPIVREAIGLEEFLTSIQAGEQPVGLLFYEEGGARLSEAANLLNASSARYPSKGNPAATVPSSPEPGCSDRYPIEEGNGRILVAVGPEGGFTREEVDLARSRGFIITSLGTRILRAETAAISAVVLTQFLLGDMD